MIEDDEALGAIGPVPERPEQYTRMDMHRDFRRAFATDEGKRVLAHLLVWTGVSLPAQPMPGHTASEAALVHEGRRAVALAVMRHIQAPQGRHDEEVTYGGRSRG